MNVIIVTANVCSLTEDAASVLENWTGVFHRLLFSLHSEQYDFIAFNFQEVGGLKRSIPNIEALTQALRRHLFTTTPGAEGETARAGNEAFLQTWWSSGLLMELGDEQFTALGTQYVVRRSAARSRGAAWFSFAEQRFSDCVADLAGELGLRAASSTQQVHAKRFAGTTSRKGWLRTRWRLGEQPMDMVNLHLYHDDSNLVALDACPSQYATKRAQALLELLRECQQADQLPAVLAGDFNFRLDLASLLNWVRVTWAPAAGLAPENATLLLHKDSFEFAHTSQLFGDSTQVSPLLAFDNEPARFNAISGVPARLLEQPVAFVPTYPLRAPPAGSYANKRIPGWCDRVMFSPAAQPLLSAARYFIVPRDCHTGDHHPVALAFRLDLPAPAHLHAHSHPAHSHGHHSHNHPPSPSHAPTSAPAPSVELPSPPRHAS